MNIWLILTSVVADFIIGDPVYRLHPVRLLGNLALFLEKKARPTVPGKKTAGSITAILTLFLAVFLTYIISATLLKLSSILGYIACGYFIYSAIACHDMIQHSKEISRQLSADNIILARTKTAMIVGRDTVHMSREEIIRATVESIAENTVDGVLAPLFYAFIGILIWGPVGAACMAILYRAVNTLDSSFGYKNEPYADFGMCSARIDDIFNFIPARISVFIIAAGAFFTGLDWKNSFQTAGRDHANHASPNSGYPEAAYAGALGVQFGGETLYHGEIINRPLLGTKTKEFSISDIARACRLLFNTTLLFTMLITLILFLITY